MLVLRPSSPPPYTVVRKMSGGVLAWLPVWSQVQRLSDEMEANRSGWAKPIVLRVTIPLCTSVESDYVHNRDTK